jgi:FtsP/CotA-like multicopper oxidase with cupredoxin domain
MTIANDRTAQSAETDEDIPAANEQESRADRRRFLGQALAATSGIVLARRWSKFVGSVLAKGARQALLVCPASSPALVPVNEITRKDGKLKAVLSVMGGSRKVPGSDKTQMLRYYAGFNPDNQNQKWPVSENAGPGPTLRCELGDSVQITFLNRVDLKKFMGTGLYSAEGGTATGLCDEINAGRFYPANDKYPNCFHASSAANVHFHGTHVTPSTTGDNVLVNVWPDPTMTDADIDKIEESFKQIFDKGEAVPDWYALPKWWRDYQMGPEPFPSNPKDRKGLVARYDDTAVYQGQRGKLPEDLRLWPANEGKITDKNWPQYYVGSYPICFRIPKWNGSENSMGQAPGTHWYHSHKHGSTSVNLFNGLEGALIIEDNSPTGYDGALKAYYSKQKPSQKLDQFVLVLQQLSDTINMLVPNPPPAPTVLVNGQLSPTITMNAGQIQLWRVINGTVQGFINAQFKAVDNSNTATVAYRQTAQDGIQLAWKNYSSKQNANPPIQMAPANRMDLLVQAPDKPGCYVLQNGNNPLLYINVTDTQTRMKFPGVDPNGGITIETDYPPMPKFLRDIVKVVEPPKRDPIVYGSRRDPAPSPTPADYGKRTLLQFTIGTPQHPNKQFNGEVDQVMTLGDAEEWQIENMDTIQKIKHPFHIHVNPFQIIEIFDPATMTEPLILQPPYVWWDTFPIPTPSNVYADNKPRLDKAGKQTFVAGYFKMRTRFVDYTGLYVQHCHILAHEDRGMMQLLQVCNDPNSPECKKQAMKAEHH